MRSKLTATAAVAGTALALVTLGASPAGAAGQTTTIGGMCLDKPGTNQFLPVTLTAKSFVKEGWVDVAGAPFTGRYKLSFSYGTDTFVVFFDKRDAGWVRTSQSRWLTTSGSPALECFTDGREFDISLIEG